MGEKMNTYTYRILVGKPDEKGSMVRLRHIWVDDIKMDLREIGLSGMEWIDLGQDRDQWRAIESMEISLLVPRNPVKSLSSFSRRDRLQE
jgi:hypothetical protein